MDVYRTELRCPALEVPCVCSNSMEHMFNGTSIGPRSLARCLEGAGEWHACVRDIMSNFELREVYGSARSKVKSDCCDQRAIDRAFELRSLTSAYVGNRSRHSWFSCRAVVGANLAGAKQKDVNGSKAWSTSGTGQRLRIFAGRKVHGTYVARSGRS